MLIISILTHSSIANPGALWKQFSQNVCDDLAGQLDLFQEIPTDFPDPHYGLFLIQRDLERRGQSCADFGMPSPILNWEEHRVNHLISDELAYDAQSKAKLPTEKTRKLNADQRICFEKILLSIETQKEDANFFLSGPAGTGKIFLYHTLCHHFRS